MSFIYREATHVTTMQIEIEIEIQHFYAKFIYENLLLH